MNDQPLATRRILVVEDEYFLANDLVRDLTAVGATIVGPVPSVAAATTLLEAQPPLDCAILDINLGGEMVYPVADALAARSVPFIFVTGYDEVALPPQYAGHARCEKPIDRAILMDAISRAIAGAG